MEIFEDSVLKFDLVANFAKKLSMGNSLTGAGVSLLLYLLRWKFEYSS